ncbi:GAF domain-containing protein [Granulicella arctica]|uniref:GAF domain-containing protein n=1 Tax=Granulicella arctica TaxID=940613 RepID=UPI0021E03424|nr:GAF domain-containing protein [Granulicella arctica]
MKQSVEELEEVGLEVTDLTDATLIAGRRLHSRNGAMQMEGLHRLGVAFVEHPDTILQELANAAVRLCGADSAGISIERADKTDVDYYRWVATAGEYSGFLDASLPKSPSACTVCLERGGPQLFRVKKRFFDILGVEAAPVTDGILLPWEVEDMRGTIFIISHSREEAFDGEDLHLMQILANFAAMGIRHQSQQLRILAQARVSAAAAMANDLAHQINNPLQALINRLFLAKQNEGIGDERSLAVKLEVDFDRLSMLVKDLLELPKRIVDAG